jgi:putative glutamine amidotransferase
VNRLNLKSISPAALAKSLMLVVTLLTVSTNSVQAAQTVDSQIDDAIKPMIGINMDVEAGKPKTFRILPDYVNAITKAGGIPVVIAPMPEAELTELVKRLDGVMMIGGNDYPPDLYKQAADKTVVPMDIDRSTFDMALVKAVLKNGRIPFLGICAGCQALNIGSGGTLVQDIPTRFTESKVAHSSPKGWQVGFNKHQIKPEAGSNLSKIIDKDGLLVVTSHHQAVDKVGDNLRIAARTEDGVTESIEAIDKDFVMGVQWHPERDYDTNKELFKEFIKQGRLRNQSKMQIAKP